MDEFIGIISGAIGGGGLTFALIKIAINQWLQSRKDFEDRTDKEILRLRDSFHKLANQTNEALLMAHKHEREIIRLQDHDKEHDHKRD